MADVTIIYKGAAIAEMDVSGSKTVETAGTYCEGDINVVYTPNSRSYEITFPVSAYWILLTALDADVLEHINDESLVVSFVNIGDLSYAYYQGDMYIVGNKLRGNFWGGDVYGIATRQQSETNYAMGNIRYPANNTVKNETNEFGEFRVSDGNYYLRPGDGGIKAGTYRLTFTW